LRYRLAPFSEQAVNATAIRPGARIVRRELAGAFGVRERRVALAVGGEHECEMSQQIHVRGPAAKRPTWSETGAMQDLLVKCHANLVNRDSREGWLPGSTPGG
jgi:hypothetical protein